LAHEGQRRKFPDSPYFVHCMEVGGYLMREPQIHGDVVVAGILHDVVEDCMCTDSDIREKFGDYVSDLVMSVTEKDKSLDWQTRKSKAIGELVLASNEVKLIKCADMLSNLRGIKLGYDQLGEAIWDRFKAGVNSQGWYNRTVASLCSDLENSPTYQEFRKLVDDVFGL